MGHLKRCGIGIEKIGIFKRVRLTLLPRLSGTPLSLSACGEGKRGWGRRGDAGVR